MSVYVNRYTRALVEERGWVPGSTLENSVALMLSDEGFTPGDFRREHPVGRYRIDFAIPDLKIAVEVDGYHHRMPGKPERDAQRDANLAGRGWTTLRISDEGDVRARVAEVSAVIREAMASRPPKPALQIQYESQVDPRGVFVAAERAKRAKSLMKAQIARLQLRALKRRRRQTV